MVIKGKILRLPDRVSGDIILPAVYARMPVQTMLEHALEGFNPDLPKRLAMSQIIVAGEGFGCGTGRESSATVLKEAGIQAIVAKSFGRLFFRNAINRGILLVEASSLVDSDVLRDGDELAIDLDSQEIRFGESRYNFVAPPQIIREIIVAGGLINYGKLLLSDQAGNSV
ncbi:MAG TPA: 3-isopropylmalate dehydratase [Candidatus Binatia bacterium]|nr:3-isopropylmalate dehydratase [Candidatus Binatia bacterium]